MLPPKHIRATRLRINQTGRNLLIEYTELLTRWESLLTTTLTQLLRRR